MKVDGEHYRTIWYDAEAAAVGIIDQTLLPHRFETRLLQSLVDVAEAIQTMRVRGAPLIGAAAAYGLVMAMREDTSDNALKMATDQLLATRPTAINLRWALDRIGRELRAAAPSQRHELALQIAVRVCEEDVTCCEAIGEHGVKLIAAIAAQQSGPVQLMTHCNAGWLATVDWGTALAPVYKAVEQGIDVHVWVSETRPRNQGLYLSAWELAAHGVAHTVVADSACGHLMQRGEVDLCIVGTDRTLLNGSVCNKIGTYLKALAAREHQVPFYVAAPSSSIEWDQHKSMDDIPIEQRSSEEIWRISGVDANGDVSEVALNSNANSCYRNDAFDVTPAAFISGLITERGLTTARAENMLALFPEHR